MNLDPTVEWQIAMHSVSHIGDDYFDVRNDPVLQQRYRYVLDPEFVRAAPFVVSYHHSNVGVDAEPWNVLAVTATNGTAN